MERVPLSARGPLLATVCALLGCGSGSGSGSGGKNETSITEARMFRDHKPSRTFSNQ
jgi:hypothetical protein